ncbi:MAG: RNA pseudouridine synthase [Pseudomonadota bacterium]
MTPKAGGAKDLAAGAASGKPGPLAGRLLYRDQLLLVLDKPAGLAVHPGPSGEASVETYLPALRFGYRETPGLAHRLDRDTSGCLALGRNARALRKLGRLFSEGRVEKTYWALVQGRPEKDQGRIDLPLAKETLGRRWRVRVDPTGQTAVTDYRVLGSGEGRAWLELRPQTGRTHQLRVHLAALGCPILGDALYGQAAASGLHLHARRLVLPLYPEKPAIAVEAPLPPALQPALESCGWTERT